VGSFNWRENDKELEQFEDRLIIFKTGFGLKGLDVYSKVYKINILKMVNGKLDNFDTYELYFKSKETIRPDTGEFIVRSDHTFFLYDGVIYNPKYAQKFKIIDSNIYKIIAFWFNNGDFVDDHLLSFLKRIKVKDQIIKRWMIENM